jgi:hypothetical protein
MFKVIRETDYRGYIIQEREIITSGGSAVVSDAVGGKTAVPAFSVTSNQWGILKRRPNVEAQEVALALSEQDAKRQIDDLVRDK